jgi:hypothetical protein
MSTASSIRPSSYPQTGRIAVGALVLLALGGGCKKKPIAEDPEERGKLTRIAARLEEAYAGKPLPPVTEPDKLADRLSRWDDFRSCTVRTFVARKRQMDKLAREGVKHTSRHGSLGEAAVEECAVESAIVNKDPSLCERLAVDYEGPNGEIPLSSVRCWDTRARVFGLPDECPVLWLPDDVPGRNAECLALARRDASFCPFADDPPRCRALLLNDPAACREAASDCQLAINYWSGLIPLGVGPPLIDLAPKKTEEGLSASVDIQWPKGGKPTIRIDGPQSALAMSWPMGKKRVALVEDTTEYWGAKVGPELAQLTWKAGQPSVKIAFNPGGAATGVRPIQPPGPLAPATVLLVWPDPHDLRRCLPGPDTTGELQFDAGAAKPGSIVTGQVNAKSLSCSDGTVVNVMAKFRIVILDVR